MAANTVNYTIERGEQWERLIVPKDRRTRRRRVPTEAAASLRITTGDNAGDYVIPTDITAEGAVLLSLTGVQTEWLEVGTYAWDMVCTLSRSALLTSTPLTELVTVRGTLTVTEYTNITPMESDGAGEALTAVA
jgi:hypothetical protein